MKTNYIPKTIILLLFAMLTLSIHGQTALSPGDITFVGVNSDDPDAFSFILLTDILSGTQIKITDNGWFGDDSAFRGGEGTITWTANSDMTSRTIILISKEGGWNASSGTVTGNVNLATTGDQLFAYQGDNTSPAFICALQLANAWDADAGSTNTSALPSALTDGTNACAIGTTDNVLYSGPVNVSSTVFNNAANWYGKNSKPFSLQPDLYPFEVFDQETDDNWETTQNWISNQLPTSTSSVIIPLNKTATINGSVSCNNLIIEYQGNLTITSPNTLSVSNNFTIQSDKPSSVTYTGSLINDGTLTVSGTTSIERYLPSDDWHLVSSPVSSQNIKVFAENNNIDQYEETYDIGFHSEDIGTWSYPISTTDATFTEFQFGIGNSIRKIEGEAGLTTFTGQLYSTFPPIAITHTNFGWNCIGNPFPSAMDITTFLSTTQGNGNQLAASPYNLIYRWDASLNDYISAASGNLALGQAFFVKSKTAGGSINFTPSMRTHASNAKFKSEEIPWPTITLLVNSGNLKNKTWIQFNNQMTDGLDNFFDRGKLKGNPDIALYSRLIEDIDKDIETQSLPADKLSQYRIPIGLDLPAGGEVTFSARLENLPPEAHIYIEDSQMNTNTQLGEAGKTYTVTVDKETAGTGRFYLLTDQTQATLTKPVKHSDFQIYSKDKKIFINGVATYKTTLTLFNLSGKIIYKKQASAQKQNKIDVEQFAPGIYVLKIESDGYTQAFKTVIN